jgi:hypothetical protein
MADSAFFVGSGTGVQPHESTTDQSFDFDFLDTEPVDQAVLMQGHIESPAQRQRQDSLFSFSSSIASKANVRCPYQAESQPYVSATDMTSQGCLQRPMEMARTEPEFSTFSNQQQSGQHRASFAGNSGSCATSMSRSSTQHSARSSGYTQHQHRMPEIQLRLAQPRSLFTAYDLPKFDHINSAAPTMVLPYDCSTTSAHEIDPIYGFGLEHGEAEADRDVNPGNGRVTCKGSMSGDQRDQVHGLNE